MFLPEQGPTHFNSDLTLSDMRGPCYVLSGHRIPCGEEGDGRPGKCVPLANQACDDKGRPSASYRTVGPVPIVQQAPTTPLGTSPSTALKSAPRPRVTTERRCVTMERRCRRQLL